LTGEEHRPIINVSSRQARTPAFEEALKLFPTSADARNYL
jgi:hypothetical protein